MKRKSICLSLLLTLCIILSCIPVYAGNADFSDGGGNSQNYSSSGSLSAGGYRSAITLKRGKTVTAYICRIERVKLKVSGSKYKWKTSNKKIATYFLRYRNCQEKWKSYHHCTKRTHRI